MSSPNNSTSSRINDSSLDILGPTVSKLLDKHNLLNNQKKIILTPIAQFIEWKMSPSVIEKIKSQPIDDQEQGFQSLAEFFQQTEKLQKIKFNVKSLDELTEGGIDVGSLTEFYGEAGGGKTQLCLQLALNCALPLSLGGLDGMTLYISTDKRFPVLRIHQMAEGLNMKHNTTIPFLDKVLVTEIIRKPDRIRSLIDNIIPQSLKDFPIKLLVIDSVAGIFRVTDNDYIKRAQAMREMVHKLNMLSDKHNFAIVTTNQLTSVPQTFVGREVASLGLAWDSQIVTKFRVKKSSTALSSSSGPVRTLNLDYSPRLPKASANFLVDSSGIA